MPHDSPRRVLVTGARGQLGVELMDLIAERTDWDAVGADIDEFDITNADSAAALVRETRPDLIINCVAYTNVDKAEDERDLAFAVNADGVGNLCDAAGDAAIAHVSTDFVFAGDEERFYVEDDTPRPVNAYGESKLAGERLLFQKRPDALCLRTAWLYGPHGRNFVDTMLRLGREREELRVVTDEVGSPTHTYDLAEAIILAAQRGLSGLYHCANAGACSRYELAQAALELAGVECALQPITSDQWPRRAKPPKHSPLDCSKLAAALGRPMRPWRDALAHYVRRVANA